MVSPDVSISSLVESPDEGTLTQRPGSQDRIGLSSSHRQSFQASSQGRQTHGGYPSLNAPPPHGPPHGAGVQYPLARSGYPGYGQYIQPPLSTPPHSFPYPVFHVQQQPQPTHASHPQYPSDNIPQSRDTPSPHLFYPSFGYVHPGYPIYPQQSPRLYPQGQHPHDAHPAAAYPQYPPPSPGDGGTWWYIPPQPAQHTPPHHTPPQYETGHSGYPFYLPPPAQQHPPSDEYFPPVSSPTYTRPATPSSPPASPPVPPSREKPLVRRPYHPNPPANRSEWVMWAGNVPSDAAHNELWRFLTQPPAEGASSSSGTGVLSIFLIPRSSCAFVNYDTEAHLQAAIARFHGVPLRADPHCARLVCRARRRDDELRAGVGGQRGMGIHTRWVEAKTEKEKASREELTSAALERSLSALSIDEAPVRPPPHPHVKDSNSSGSQSLASTTSSLLRQHFPQRFFILKSFTQDDLDLSVQTGLWTTQSHNEGVLDRAFRTSTDVFLIFSANKSGEFFGYARMAGPVGSGGDGDGGVKRARHDSHTSRPPIHIHLSDSAPFRAMRTGGTGATGERAGLQLGSVAEDEQFGGAEASASAEGRGQEFALQWLCTARLPFGRTRHIRNPWNHDREVKVSRDGTEIEPTVGQALLEEWRLYLAAEGAGRAGGRS